MDSFFKNFKAQDYKNNYILINIVLAADFAVGKTAFVLRLQNKNYKNYRKQDEVLSATTGSHFFY